MAIEKDIAVKCRKEKCSGAKGVGQMLDYITDSHHDHEKVNIKNLLDYTKNAEKTTVDDENSIIEGHIRAKTMLISSISGGELVSTLDEIDFMEDKEKYLQYKRNDRRGMGLVDKGEACERDAYHVVQSFPGGVYIDPYLAHQIGIEYAKRAFPGYKVVVTTHLNTDHVHNHIGVCAYNEDGMHKLNFNGTFRRQIRKINDEINMEYGLPILKEYKMYGPKNTNYAERLVRKRNGMSMKDQVCSDIDRVLEEHGKEFKDFSEFVRYMEEHENYEIRQSAKYVTYIKKDLLMKNGKPFRVRDSSLGDEYMRYTICYKYSYPEWSAKNEGKSYTEMEILSGTKRYRLEERVRKNRPPQDEEPYEVRFWLDPGNYFERDATITVKRYDDYGRRRSNIELIILAVIKIIKYIIDRIQKRFTGVGMIARARENVMSKHTRITARYDLNLMLSEYENTLHQVRKYHIESMDDIVKTSVKLNGTANGLLAEKSFYDKRITGIQETIDLRNRIRKLSEELQVKPDDDFFCIYTPSADEIKLIRREYMPVSGKQKQKLYQLLNEDGQKYVLKCRFEDLGYQEADRVIRFLEGKDQNKPDVAADPEEQKAEKMQRLYRKIFDKIEHGKQTNPKLNVPISKVLIDRIKPYITEAGITIDLSELTMGQGLSILQHFREIPLTEDKAITKTQQDALMRRLEAKGLTLNKPVEYVLKSEYAELKSFLDTGKGKTPSVLQKYKPISLCTRTQIKDCLELTGRSLVIPIEHISEEQGKILVSDLLYKLYVPKILQPEESDIKAYTPAEIKEINNRREAGFTEKCAHFSRDDQYKLIEMRRCIVDLYAHGERVEEGPAIGNTLSQDRRKLKKIEEDLEETKSEQKSIDELEEQIILAQHFIENPHELVKAERLYEQELKQKEEHVPEPTIEPKDHEPEHHISVEPDIDL